MKPLPPPPPPGTVTGEISALISRLHETSQRLEELTAGQIDTVSDAEGRTFVLRRAQEDLRQSEASRQVAILNALPAHVALLDAEGTVVSVNEAWRRFAEENGLEGPRYGIGLNYLAICDQASVDESASAQQAALTIRAVLAGGAQSVGIEYPCHSPAQMRWFLMATTSLPGVLGGGAVVMHVDITQRVLGEDALRRSEEEFRAMFELASVGIAQADPRTGRLLRVNQKICEITGYSAGEMLEMRISEFTHPDDREEDSKRFQQALRAGSADYRMEKRYLRKDGSVAWVNVNMTIIRDAAHNPVRTMAAIEGITERKNAEAKIAHLSRVQAMLSGISIMIVRVSTREELFNEACRIAVVAGGFRMSLIAIVDPELGRIVPLASAGEDEGLLSAVNRTLSDRELAPQTLVARAIRRRMAMVSNDSQSDPRVQLEPRFTESAVRSMAVLPLMMADEAVGVLALYSAEVDFFHEEEMKLLTDLANEIAFCMGALTSRSHEERADEELRASLKEKEALLKEVHHRVKNNMQVITSLLRLEANRIDHPTTRAVLKDMQNRILAMAGLHEALYRSNNFAHVDLGLYLRELTTQLKRSLVASPGQVTFHLQLLPVSLNLDQAVPCGLIVNELVSNALKHGFPAGRSGEVRVETEWVRDGWLRLRVSDDGIGLSSRFAEIRVKSLGLQLVADLARQLGGSLVVGPGPQAVFEVTFRPEATG